MSIDRHHNEWLSLVPNSGPFLSLPVLMRTFPQGLPAPDPELQKETRLMFESWEDGRRDRAVRRAWPDYVLRSVLQFPPEVITEGPAIPPGMEGRMFEFGEVLRPDMAIIPPQGGNSLKPRLLVQFFHPDPDLEKPLRDQHWKASPATRMTELLHAADVPLGLLTNGEHWMLVHAPRGETSGFASWYAPLWFEEPLTFQAFQALLSAQRFFGVAENDTIEALLTQSAQNQQEVTAQLGWQVRKAVEVLIQSFDKIDQDCKRQLLEGVSWFGSCSPLMASTFSLVMSLWDHTKAGNLAADQAKPFLGGRPNPTGFGFARLDFDDGLKAFCQVRVLTPESLSAKCALAI